ncbi:hypothetical protein Pst134EA_004899 [Puccinia striiformis f. sp. tritici]|nr:hypothetical protein Pst134EA_004899 [Puccinia striiformis f. sp. tritici]KAH9470989.1 hypothetical protein Pst134EA_004899 [Puccinia striiformis f. sp. tritici]
MSYNLQLWLRSHPTSSGLLHPPRSLRLISYLLTIKPSTSYISCLPESIASNTNHSLSIHTLSIMILYPHPPATESPIVQMRIGSGLTPSRLLSSSFGHHKFVIIGLIIIQPGSTVA